MTQLGQRPVTGQGGKDAGDGSAGGRFLIYQGQVRPGARIGEIIEQQDWQPDPPAPGKR